MVLGVDYGDARTGFAISDELKFLARTLEVYSERKMSKVAERTVQLAEEYDVELIVVGLPKNMDGSIGDRGKKTTQFAEMLKEKCEREILLWDERLTTVSAHNLMNETNVRGKKRKETVDKIAAAFILQSYLDSKR